MKRFIAVGLAAAALTREEIHRRIDERHCTPAPCPPTRAGGHGTDGITKPGFTYSRRVSPVAGDSGVLPGSGTAAPEGYLAVGSCDVPG